MSLGTKIKNPKGKITLTVAILLYAFVRLYFDIPCPILALTGIECIGCGMTRALVYAFKLDFVSAFSYHYMFWSLPLLYYMLLVDGRVFKNKNLNCLLYTILIIGFLLNWLLN